MIFPRAEKKNLAGICDHEKLIFRKGSITDPVLLTEVMRGVDTVYHLAAAVGVKLVADDPVRTIGNKHLSDRDVIASRGTTKHSRLPGFHQ